MSFIIMIDWNNEGALVLSHCPTTNLVEGMWQICKSKQWMDQQIMIWWMIILHCIVFVQLKIKNLITLSSNRCIFIYPVQYCWFKEVIMMFWAFRVYNLIALYWTIILQKNLILFKKKKRPLIVNWGFKWTHTVGNLRISMNSIVSLLWQSSYLKIILNNTEYFTIKNWMKLYMLNLFIFKK